MYQTTSFKKKMLATAIASAAASFSGIAFAQEDGVEEVMVTGIKGALQRSVDIKRNSSQILEAVTADDIGKMPDQNVAESLQRLPGVQIDRRDGEGTKVRIRGLDQNITLLNGGAFISGMEYFQLGEAKTEYNGSLEGIPSELLGGLEVYKTPAASLIEGGMGGVVNLKTRDPLSLDDMLVAANLKVDQGDASEDAKPSGFVVVGNRWDNFAAIASFTANSKTVRTNSYDAVSRGLRLNNLPSGEQFVSPTLSYITDNEQERERVGGSINLAWSPSDQLSFGFDWFHSDLLIENAAYTVKHTFRDNNDNINTPEEENATSLKDVGPFNVLTKARVTMGEGEVNAAGETFDSTADNIVLKFKADPTDRVSFSGDISYSMADAKQRAGYSDSRFDQYRMTRWVGTDLGNGGTANGWGDAPVPNNMAPANSTFFYDTTGGGMPKIGFEDFATFNNPQNMLFKSHWALGSDVDQDALAIRGDMTVDVSGKRLKTLKFGFRHANESTDFDELRYLSDFSKTTGAMSPNLYNANGSLNTASTFDPNTAPGAGMNNVGVREAVYYDLCGNGGIPAGKQCDIDGDGLDDNQPFGPYGYFVDAAIGLKAFDLTTSNGSSMAEMLYGADAVAGGANRWHNSPGYLPWETYAQNPNRVVKINDFFSGGSYNTSSVYIEDASKIVADVEGWRKSVTPNTPGAWFQVPFESWSVEQITDAFYTEADFEGVDIPYTLNVGVRAVNTRVNITKATVDNPEATTWSIATDGWNSQGVLLDWAQATETKSYWDVLPSMNFTLDINDDNKLRITAAKVLARPNMQDLGKGFSKNFTRADNAGPDGDITFYKFIGGSDGSPGLDPYRATQADIAYEWYFDDLGMMSTGVFFKSVDSFIAMGSVNWTEVDGNPDSADGSSTAPVTKPINGDGGSVHGVEFQVQQAWENGFGASFNYTYSTSETTASSTSDKNFGLPGVSENAFNLMGFYETDIWSARLAYSWRDDYVSPNRSVFGVANSAYTVTERFEAYGQWDGQVTYNLSENISFNLEAINITAEDQEAYFGWKELPSQYINQERRFVLGVTYRM